MTNIMNKCKMVLDMPGDENIHNDQKEDDGVGNANYTNYNYDKDSNNNAAAGAAAEATDDEDDDCNDGQSHIMAAAMSIVIRMVIR